jgi:hypothetical protein
MGDFNSDPKAPFINLLRKQRKELKDLLEFYKETEQHTPPDVQWKILRQSPFEKWIYPFARQTEKILPSAILEVAIQTLDEYIGAVENFSFDQLKAFFLGLGLKWIPFQYWGLKHLREHHKQLTQVLRYFENLESKTPESHRWKHSEKDPIRALDDIEPKLLLHSEIISRDLGLVEAILSVLRK